MRRTLLLTTALALGCGAPAGPDETGTGAIELAVANQALGAVRLIQVEISCVPARGGEPYVRRHDIPLASGETSIRSRFGGLPVGTCDFTAAAFETGDTSVPPAFAGSSRDVPIVAGQPQNLVIILHGQRLSDPFHTSAPWISSLLVSSAAGGPGGTIRLRVVAHDEEDDAAGIPRTYQWAADGGSFGAAGAPESIWIAPLAPSGIFDLSILVTDADGSSARLSDIRVAAGSEYLHGGVGAGFQLELNQGPQVERIASVQVAAADPEGIETMVHQLDVTATDPEGLPLDLAWSADAGCGRFLVSGASWEQQAAGARALFQATDPAGCRVRVVATEVRDDGVAPATGSGTIKLRPIGRAVEQEPLIVATWQSHEETWGQQEVELAAEIVVPYSTDLPFAAWTTDAGELVVQEAPAWIEPGQPELGSYVSAIWTAPSCFLEPVEITLTATDALGAAWTSHVFTVGSLIDTCP